MSCSVNQSVRRILRSKVLASLAAAGIAGPVMAADAGPPAPAADEGTATGLQEVVVTAQFRSENVQQTPLAITAVSAADLAERGETSITDISSNAPSVLLSQSAGGFGPSMSAFIRGIGQADLDPALEPGVGIYIDDVYFGTLTGSIFDLLDLDRVEVLRGPQGTLEGMNSEGGAVKLYSKKPDATESMSFDLLAGSRGHVQIRAGTNFAITDSLFVRLSAVGNQQDGDVTRYDFSCVNPTVQGTAINTNVAGDPLVPGTYQTLQAFPLTENKCVTGHEGGVSTASARLALRWLATDQLEMNFIADYANSNNQPVGETLGVAAPSLPVGSAAANSTGAVALGLPTQTPGYVLPYNSALVPALIPKGFYSSYANFCLPAPTPAQTIASPIFGSNVGTQAYCVDPNVIEHNWGVSWTTDWQAPAGLVFKNIAAFRGYTSSWAHDNDVSAWNLDLGAEGISHHQFSDEIRLSGSFAKLVDWTFGTYYFSEKSQYFGHEDLSYAFAGVPLNGAGLPAGPGGVGYPLLFNFYQDDPITAHNEAAFIHTTWHLTSSLDAILAARYTSQDKDYTYIRVNDSGTAGGGAAIVENLNGTTAKYSASRHDWRAVLDYHLNDAVMVYAQYSTGFKGGGVTPRPFYAPQAVPFAPESLDTSEVGLKTSWLDNHVHANIDAYFSQYQNIQLTLANCAGIQSVALANLTAPPGVNYGQPCAAEVNAGSGHQRGVEFETEARIGGLKFDANISWLHFNYTYLSGYTPATPLGSTLIPISDVTPYTPTWTANAGVQYTVPIGSRGSLTARLDGNTRSEIYTSAQNDPYNRTPGYAIYNAHLTWANSKANWQAIFQVKNLADRRYYIQRGDLISQGTQVDLPGAPRELDLEIKHKM